MNPLAELPCGVCDGDGEIYPGEQDMWGMWEHLECNHCRGTGVEPLDDEEWTP